MGWRLISGGKDKPSKKQRRKEKGPPPQPLAERTKASKRNPDGLPRCQRWDANRKDTGQFWQCPNPVRPGFPVCGMHGAGHEVREKRGEKEHPKQAGLIASPPAGELTPDQVTTIASHPVLGALYRRHLGSGDLLDLRPSLAAAKAIADHYIAQCGDDTRDHEFGADAPALKAIKALHTVVATAKELLKIEEKLGPVTRAELEMWQNAFADTFARFVPAELHEEARLHFARRVATGYGREADGAAG